MALKFRRGTTAQQSGSLAFGEPFVNTTLGTLLVGGPNGDIVLSSAGTGSTGNFGAISGSGLDITGNANIAGNLTLGGAITIGDASADTINVIASVSSSIIPSVTNAFDLGSEDYFWRDIYVSTGSIKFVGAAGNVVGTLTNIGNGLNLDAGIVTKGNSSFGTSSLAVTSVTGSLRVSGSLNVIGGINGVINATNDVVSGSSQVIAILDSLNTFSGSSLTRFTEIGVVSGSLISSASAAKTTNDSQGVSITNLNTTTASLLIETANLETFSGSALTRLSALEVETANLETFSGSVLTRLTEIGVVSGSLITSASAAKTTNDSQGVSITNLNSFTSSINTTIKSKLDADGVVSGSSQITYANISSIPAGIISGSSQLSGTSITDLTIVNLTTVNQTASVVFSSGSNRFGDFGDDIHDFTGSVKISGSIVTIGASTATSFNGTINATNGVVSGSSQILGGSGLVSGSSQVTLQSTTGFTTYDTALATITGSLISSASAAKTTNDSQDVSITNLNSATASLLIETANLESFSSSALTRLTALEVETSNLESFTSSINTTIKNRLDANTVVSGSSQVIGILSSLNTYTGSNDTTNTTQNSRLDQLSTASGSAITRLSALEVETANLETFSSSALTRLNNLEGTDFTITLTGDVTGTGTVTNLSSVSFATTVAANSVALGTDTTGNYMTNVSAGNAGIVISHTQSEGSTATISLVSGVVSGSSQINVASTTGDIALGTRTSGNYVASLVAGTGITLSNNSGEGATPTIAIGQVVATSSNVQFNSLGVGMAASATAGRIDATNDVVAYSSSDIRFKENIKPIENAIDKIRKISGNTYDWKEENKIEHGYEGNDVGVIAQEIEAVLPQLVQTRESGYKAVKYDKLVALLIEGIKEQQLQIEQLRIDLDNCRNNKGL